MGVGWVTLRFGATSESWTSDIKIIHHGGTEARRKNQRPTSFQPWEEWGAAANPRFLTAKERRLGMTTLKCSLENRLFYLPGLFHGRTLKFVTAEYVVLGATVTWIAPVGGPPFQRGIGSGWPILCVLCKGWAFPILNHLGF